MKINRNFHVRRKGKGRMKLRHNPLKSYMSYDQDYDSDMAYERWRDDWGDRLYDGLEELYKKMVETPSHGYYKGDSDKFVRHSITILEGMRKRK